MKILITVFFILTLILNSKISSQPNYPVDPKEASLVGSDLKNFIEAYRSLTADSDTIQVLQTEYFDKASPGLKEYIARFELTPEAIMNAIQDHPESYEKIDKFYDQMPVLETEYISELENYNNIIPKAMFPPTYLLVTDHKGINQASKYGQLISIEKGHLENPELLKNTIIHELTHFQQAMSMGVQNYTAIYTKKDNMLDLVLREGGAEFITYYLVRQNEDQFTKLKNYEKNEPELWEKFNTDLKNQDVDYWMNVTYEDNNKGIPIQLGYGLGYKIVKSYYDQETDKEKAINDILNISNTSEFFAKSNYSPE